MICGRFTALSPANASTLAVVSRLKRSSDCARAAAGAASTSAASSAEHDVAQVFRHAEPPTISATSPGSNVRPGSAVASAPTMSAWNSVPAQRHSSFSASEQSGPPPGKGARS